MKVLMMKPGPYEVADLEEYFQGLHCEVETASNLVTLSQALLKGDTDLLLFNVTSMDDFAQIRYVNTHYPDVTVLVLAENGLGAMIDNVRQGAFSALRKPFHLQDLSDYIDANAEAKHS